jgi:hypothetical protein
MFANSFYNQTTRRYVAIFGTLFNDISIGRSDNNSTEKQRFKVPINYGPSQKFLSKIEQDESLNSQAITLPRMSFELRSMTYDGDRKLTDSLMNRNGIAADDRVRAQYTAAPYNLDFELTIMAKYSEDATKILEQIIPFFKPHFTVTAKMIDSMDMVMDIPIILNGISTEDTYEGSYDQRRAITWTLDFTLKGYYYGPTSERKVIKFANTDIFSTMSATLPVSRVKVQPGLTSNNLPTTDITQTVPYSQINVDDDWAYIVRIETL